MSNIYERAAQRGAIYVGSCVGISERKFEELTKGARKAARLKVLKVALQANVIDEAQYNIERKNPYYNPYEHWVTKTHVIYRESSIEHFIKIAK